MTAVKCADFVYQTLLKKIGATKSALSIYDFRLCLKTQEECIYEAFSNISQMQHSV